MNTAPHNPQQPHYPFRNEDHLSRWLETWYGPDALHRYQERRETSPAEGPMTLVAKIVAEIKSQQPSHVRFMW